MTRPTLTDLSPAQSISSNPGNELITRGNPDLLPFRASQLEGGLEWYFADYSLLSGTVFYKSIDSFVARSSNSTQQVDQVVFHINQPVNGKGATVNGFELGYKQVFGRLPAPFDGLGVNASYTYTKSDADYSNAGVSTHYGLLGLSKNSYTAEVFYEKGPVQAHVAYTNRSSYLVNVATQTSNPLFSDGYKQVDAGISYTLMSHLTLSLDALNLGNSNEFLYASTPDRTEQFSNVGRRYSFSVRYKY
jgi:TonB-dependent receptor